MINPIQAISEGGRLTVRTTKAESEERASDAQWVKIKVMDEGCGIPSEVIGRVLDPYISTKEPGDGLGLSVCYSIMKRPRAESGSSQRNELVLPSACGFRFARGWLGAALMLVSRPPKLPTTASTR